MQPKYSFRSESVASIPSFYGDRERSRAEVELAQQSAALKARMVLDSAVAHPCSKRMDLGCSSTCHHV